MTSMRRRILIGLFTVATLVTCAGGAQAVGLVNLNAINVPGLGWVVGEPAATRQDLNDAIAAAKEPALSVADAKAAAAEGARREALNGDFKALGDAGVAEDIAAVKADVQHALDADWNAQRSNVSADEIRNLLSGAYSASAAPEMVTGALADLAALATSRREGALLFTRAQVAIDEWQGVRVADGYAVAQLTGRQRFVREGSSSWQYRPIRWRLFLAREQGDWRIDDWFAEPADGAAPGGG